MALNDTYQVSSTGHKRCKTSGVQGTSSSKGGKRAHGRREIEMNGALKTEIQIGSLWWPLPICQTLWGTLYVIPISYKLDNFKSPLHWWEDILLMTVETHRDLEIFPSHPAGGRSRFKIKFVRSKYMPPTSMSLGKGIGKRWTKQVRNYSSKRQERTESRKIKV